MENNKNFNKPLPWVRTGPASKVSAFNLLAAEVDREHNEKIDKMVKNINSKPVAERIRIVENIISIYVDWNKEFRFKNLEDYESSLKTRNIELIADYSQWLQELKALDRGEDNDVSLPEGLDISTIALLHVYWGQFDASKQLTSRNIRRYTKLYGKGKNHLLPTYAYYLEYVGHRLEAKNGDTRSVNKIKKRFQTILPLLEKECRQAFIEASKHFEIFKTRYELLEK